MSTPVATVDAVKLYAPKFRPEIVTLLPPDFTAFSGVYARATGAADGSHQPHCLRECLPCGPSHLRSLWPQFHRLPIRLFPTSVKGSIALAHTPNDHHITLPSKVNTLRAFVPTTAPTVTFEYVVLSVVGALSRHCAVVSEDQDVVAQSTSPTACPVGVKPYTPKFRPEIVTVDPPDVAALIGTS
jgi:hypothetical protein